MNRIDNNRLLFHEQYVNWFTSVIFSWSWSEHELKFILWNVLNKTLEVK